MIEIAIEYQHLQMGRMTNTSPLEVALKVYFPFARIRVVARTYKLYIGDKIYNIDPQIFSQIDKHLCCKLILNTVH